METVGLVNFFEVFPGLLLLLALRYFPVVVVSVLAVLTLWQWLSGGCQLFLRLLAWVLSAHHALDLRLELGVRLLQ